MKTRVRLLAVLLMCVVLAGCSTNVDLQKPETAGTVLPEATAEPSDVAEEITVPATEPTVPVTVETEPVMTAPQKQVTVQNADEFLAAIAPDTQIVVTAELIDLSRAEGYGVSGSDYYYWEATYDGPELCITGVSNLTICGSGEDHNLNTVSSVPRYSNVLRFFNCSNVTVKGLTAGHTEEPGYCIGGVLLFLNCQDALVEDCGLFGCGTFGVIGENSKNLRIINNDIYECSVGGVSFTKCDAVNVDGNTFRDLDGPEFRVYDCGSVTRDGERVFDSYLGY